MRLRVLEDRRAVGKAAAEQAAAAIRGAIGEQGRARIVAASAASQVEFLEALAEAAGVNWKRVEMFHLDEYIGVAMTHPASFCRFLRERLIAKTGIAKAHFLNGERDVAETIREANEAIREAPIDVAFVGIGENGHLAFNDPPADFETEEPYIVVSLEEACRRQQVGEGWFADLAAVPKRAISMSVKQILKAKEIVAVVPGAKKAEAVKACLEGPIRATAPASILRTHGAATVYLDRESAALLTAETLSLFGELRQP